MLNKLVLQQEDYDNLKELKFPMSLNKSKALLGCSEISSTIMSIIHKGFVRKKYKT